MTKRSFPKREMWDGGSYSPNVSSVASNKRVLIVLLSAILKGLGYK